MRRLILKLGSRRLQTGGEIRASSPRLLRSLPPPWTASAAPARKTTYPGGLLTRAWCVVASATTHRLLNQQKQAVDCETSAQRDLDEAWEIAERGPMKLFLADLHLHRARLFFREKPYPWESPQADLAAAGKLIHDCGYHRRDPELAAAKLAILS